MSARAKKTRLYPWILGCLTLLGITAVVYGPALLPTEWVRDLTATVIQDKVCEALKEKVKVSIDIVEWRRWNRVRLHNLVILRQRQGVQAKEPDRLLTISDLSLHLSLGELFRKKLVVRSLRIRRPVLTLDREQFARLELRPPAPEDQGPLTLAVEGMNIRQAMLTVTDGPARLFQASGFNLSAEGKQEEPLKYRMSFYVKSPPFTGRIDANGQLLAYPGTPPGLILEGLSLASAAFSARATGKMSFGGGGPQLDLRLSTRLQADEVNKLFAQAARRVAPPLRFAGVLASESRISGPLTDLKIEGFVDFPQGTVRIGALSIPFGAESRDISYAFTLREDELEVSRVLCLTPVGSFSATGKVAALKTKPRVSLALAGRDIDTALLYSRACEAAKAHPGGWQVKGKISSDLALAAEGKQCSFEGRTDLARLHIVGMGGLALKPADAPWELVLKGSADDKALLLKPGTRFRGDIFDVALSGGIRFEGREPSVDLAAESRMDMGQAVNRWGRACLELPERLDIAGQAATVAKISGALSNLNISWVNDASQVAWSLDGKPLKDAGPAAGSRFRAMLAGGAITIQQGDFYSQFGKASLTGSVSGLDEKPVFGLKLSSDLDLSAVQRILALHGYRLPPDWKITGNPRLASATVQGPAENVTVRADVDLKDVSVSWRQAEIFKRGEPSDFNWSLAVERGQVRLREVFFRSRGGELTLGPAIVDGGTGLAGSGVLRVDELRPSIIAALGYARDLALESDLPPSVVALFNEARDDVKIGGSVRFPNLSIRETAQGLRFHGSADLTRLAVSYRGICLKDEKDQVTADLDATVGEAEVVLASANLNSAIGATHLSGKVRLDQALPRFELRLKTNGDFQKLISFLPVEKVKADAGLNQALRDLGVDVAEMDDKFDVAGVISAEAHLEGTAQGVSWGLEADLSGLDVTYSAAFRKGAEEMWRLRLAGRASPKVFTLSSAVVEASAGRAALEGDVRVSLPLVSGRDVKLSLGDRTFDASFQLSHVRPGGFWLDFIRVREGERTLACEGPVVCEPDVISAEDARILVNKEALQVKLLAKDYYSKTPEIRLRVRGATLDLRPFIPAQPPPKDAAAQPSRIRFPAGLPERVSRFFAQARIDLSVFLGEFAFHFYDSVDKNPGVREYLTRGVSLEAVNEKGVLRAELAVGVNGGMVDVVVNGDFNQSPPTMQEDSWGASLAANDNLRPFMNLLFPNLYVDKEISFRSNLKWQGLTLEGLDTTQAGESVFEIKKGHMIGKAAPEFILKVFPNLNLYDYRFDDCKVVCKARGRISRNKVTFLAPTFNLFMIGQTCNDTKDVDYIVGVDMVANMGLEPVRDHIPRFWQDSAKITIARYRGHIHDQHVEWFEPKLDNMRDTLGKLLPLQTVKVLASSDKTAADKAKYFGKRLERILLFPVSTAKRFAGAKKKDKEPLERAEPPPMDRENKPGAAAQDDAEPVKTEPAKAPEPTGNAHEMDTRK